MGQPLLSLKTSWSGLGERTPGLKQSSYLDWVVLYLMMKNAHASVTAEALKNISPGTGCEAESGV